MISQNQLAELLFEEFSTFLENTEILKLSLTTEVQQEYHMVCELFEKKIRRCEVGDTILLPFDISQTCALFLIIGSHIEHSLLEKGTYFKQKDYLLHRALAEFSTSYREILPLEQIINSIYNEWYQYFLQYPEEREIPYDTSTYLFELVMYKYVRYYSGEMLRALHHIAYEMFNEVIHTESNSKTLFLHKVVERLGETPLLSQMFVWDVLTNIAYKCLNFLTNKGYISFQEGCAVVSRKKLSNGLHQFRKKMRFILPEVPFHFKRDLVRYTEFVLEEMRNILERGAINGTMSLEETISKVVGNIFNRLEDILSQAECSSFENHSKKILKTYKVGLRVPESLLEEQNALIRTREIVQFLCKKHRRQLKRKGITGDFAGFIRYKRLDQASSKVREWYKKEYNKYREYSLKELLNERSFNNARLKSLKHANPTLNSKHFTDKDVPHFSDPSHPRPRVISVRDYQYLAGKSFKMVCKYVNAVARKYITALPPDKELLIEQVYLKAQSKGKKITRGSMRIYPEMAIANLLDRYSNTDQVAFFQMAAALEAHGDLRQKVEYMNRLLFPSDDAYADFSVVVPVLLAYYSIPNYFKQYLAKAWNTDAQWVRNTLVGWRRRVDPHLPVLFQIEPLTLLLEQLAQFCLKYVQNDGDRKVIKLLQKSHMLHLISKIDLSPLLPKELRESFYQVRSKIPPYPSELTRKLKARTLNLSILAIENAVNELMESVRDVMDTLDPTSRGFENCKTFLTKLKIIKKCSSGEQYRFLFENYLPGNRFTSSAGILLKHSDFAKKSGIRHLFTALRGVASLAFAGLIPEAIAQFESVFTPDNCLNLPFTSSKRRTQFLPALLLSPKYVVERKTHPLDIGFLNNEKATEILRSGKVIWLGIPIYSPDQASQFRECLEGKRKTVRRRGIFWFQLKTSKKIVECLNRGATVQSIRLNVPHGPTNKIIADVTLSGSEPEVFARRGNFLKVWGREYGEILFPTHDFLGSDFNRIGTNLLAVATPDLEIDLTSGSNMMKPYKKAHEKLEKYRKVEIPHLQRNLTSRRYTKKELGRRKAQITLLHRKRQNIMNEMKRRALMVYLYAAYRTGAKYIGWDTAQGISTRGTRGALATAITYMPNRKALYDEFVLWAENLRTLGFLSEYISTEPITPFTSRICAECFQNTGAMKRTLVQNENYHTVECSVCKWCGNRHHNSARLNALLLQQYIHIHVLDPVSAIDGLG